MNDPKIIVALDYDNADSALNFASKVSPDLCKLKVGNELFTNAGPQLVSKLVDKGFKVFLDLKFHDIPNTVARACEAATKLGVWIEKDERRVNAKSLLGVLSLGIVKGTTVTLVADGADEQEAIDTLTALINSDFSE